jgi:hypothetical protein
MKINFINNGIIFFYVCLLIGLNSCVISQEGGSKVYEATASTEEGEKLVAEYDVKYICENVISLFFADISRSKSGIFAIDVKYTMEGKIQYRPISGELTVIYGLEPKFSWWDNHGLWVAIPLTLIMIFLGCLIISWFRNFLC